MSRSSDIHPLNDSAMERELYTLQTELDFQNTVL